MAGLAWDDLRFILAVVEAGSLAAAARRLKVNHTTVLRRIGAAERQLGARLLERRPNGYVPTAAGEELVAVARQTDEAMAALERKLAGRDLRLSGALRVTTTDTLMASVLPGILAGFRAAQSGIQVEIAISNAMFNLTRRDADVAIRPARNPPETLVGRRVAKVAFAVYGSRAYLAQHKDDGDLATHRWVAPDDSMAETSVAHWMRTTLPGAEVTLRADSLLALRQAAASGLGLAALPCYLGDRCEDLVRVRPPVAAMETALWILTHADLRHTARVRAFTDFAAAELARMRPVLEGKQGSRK